MLPSRIFFDDFFDNFDSTRKLERTMKCDIYENDGKYILELDIPGFQKEDINMELHNGYLKVYVNKELKDEYPKDKNYIHRERHYITRCERQFYIGDVSEKDIHAKYKDGVLKIQIPKTSQTKDMNKRIEIED